MTTYYVSKSTDNGYVVGNDSNDGLAKSTPFLTLDRASDIAKAAAGSHTIIINDGIYVGTDIDSANSYWIFASGFTADDLTFQCENSGNVQIIPGVATAIVRISNSTGYGGKSITFNGIKFGREITSLGGADGNYAFWVSDTSMASAVNVSFTDCEFINAAIYSVNNAASMQANYTFTNCTHTADRVNTRSFIYSPTHAEGGLTIDGLTITHTKHNNSGSAVIFFDASVANVTCSIENVTGTIAIDSTDTAVGSVMYGIFVANCDNALVNNVNLSLDQAASGATWGTYGIVVYGNDATLTATAPKIYDCHITATGWNAAIGAGFCIAIGSDLGNRQANKSDGAKIIGCSATGDATSVANGLHGIGIVENDNSEIRGCTVSFSDIGFLLKLTATSIVSGCFAKSIGVGGLSQVAYYNKGGTNDDFFNNTFIHDANSDSAAFLAAVDGVTNTTGAEFKYNYIHVESDTSIDVISVAASQTATFDFNYYYTASGVSLHANPFLYQAINYASIDAWLTARETNGQNLGSTNPVDSSYMPISGSALVGAGRKWWTGANPVSAGGEPYSDFDTDIGGYQSVFGSFHPLNL